MLWEVIGYVVLSTQPDKSIIMFVCWIKDKISLDREIDAALEEGRQRRDEDPYNLSKVPEYSFQSQASCFPDGCPECGVAKRVGCTGIYEDPPCIPNAVAIRAENQVNGGGIPDDHEILPGGWGTIYPFAESAKEFSRS